MKKAYISCPLDEALYKIREVSIKLKEMGYEVSYYIRGDVYSDQKLRDADIFVLIPSNNRTIFSKSEMTWGCSKELELAQTLTKSIYLAHEIRSSTWNIWSIDLRRLCENQTVARVAKALTLTPVPVIINQYEIY